ncbi:NFX1-type zinc finger-containing protein 1-like [Arctopsyche grandis]|uniref:NFX1-type zinc finger-containing protein 1-like n=1 Tax=Arctopsyche grandis TaxID=121162 RepID=UPI00406D6ABD
MEDEPGPGRENRRLRTLDLNDSGGYPKAKNLDANAGSSRGNQPTTNAHPGKRSDFGFSRGNRRGGLLHRNQHSSNHSPRMPFNLGRPNTTLENQIQSASSSHQHNNHHQHPPGKRNDSDFSRGNSRGGLLHRNQNSSNHSPIVTKEKGPMIAPTKHRKFQSNHQNNKGGSNNMDMSHVVFGFKQLLDMSSKDGSEILMVFSQQNRKFDNTLTKEIKPDNIVLFMKCISKVCGVMFDESKTNIMTKLCESNFLNTFEKYILNLPYATTDMKMQNKLFWDDCDDFWKNVFAFYDCVISSTPDLALGILSKLIDFSKITLQNLKDRHKVNYQEELLQTLANIQMRLIPIKEEFAEKLHSRKGADEDLEVPNDFRKSRICPDVTEISTKNHVFLRPNIINGAYNSVDHYLDVQFRLMREDFIRPMREAIMRFIYEPTQRKYNGGRFYREAKFKYFAISNKRAGLLVAFDENSRRKNPKAFYKRFLFGSLLCFTKDKFKTCFFGTIVESSEVLLSRGMIIVDLKNEDITGDLFTGTYVMFESDVFFSQYGPVLEALQLINDNFPLKDYIVYMQMLETVPRHVDGGYKIHGELIKDLNVDIINNLGWPSAVQLGLDDYQYNTYRMALSREFVTIQGPPGTGKTFIGLKIVNTLLENVPSSEKPLLVICFTNHALDQFLCGILPTNKKVVRIGGQSKNEQLAKNYNLHNLRRQYGRANPHARNLLEVIDLMNKVQNAILHIEANDGIVDLNLLNEYLPNNNINDYLRSFESKDFKSRLANWLLMSDNRLEIWKYLNKDVFQCYQDVIAVKHSKHNDCLEFDGMRNMLAEDFEDNQTPQVRVKYEKISMYSFAKEIYKIDKKIENDKLKNDEKQKLNSNRNYILCQLFCLQVICT